MPKNKRSKEGKENVTHKTIFNHCSRITKKMKTSHIADPSSPVDLLRNICFQMSTWSRGTPFQIMYYSGKISALECVKQLICITLQLFFQFTLWLPMLILCSPNLPCVYITLCKHGNHFIFLTYCTYLCISLHYLSCINTYTVTTSPFTINPKQFTPTKDYVLSVQNISLRRV